MVERLNRSAQFHHLRAHSTTVREGRLRISFAEPEPSIGPGGAAVGFVVPRSYGTAVRRNRLRRRLREIVRDCSQRGDLPDRWLLVKIMGSPDEPTHAELHRWFNRAIERIPASIPPDPAESIPDGSGP